MIATLYYIVITLLTDLSPSSPLNYLLIKRGYILFFFLFIFVASASNKVPSTHKCTIKVCSMDQQTNQGHKNDEISKS